MGTRDPEEIFQDDPKESPFALKPRTLADLPSDEVFLAYLAEAARLNEEGAKVPRQTPRHRRRVARRGQAPQLEIHEGTEEPVSHSVSFAHEGGMGWSS